MKHEERTTIRLVNSHLQGTVTYYRLILTHKGRTYSFCERYSKLCTISKTLPRTAVDFPTPHHIQSLFSVLTGNSAFLANRLQSMTQYFESFNREASLTDSQGLLKMIESAINIDSDSSDTECQEPQIAKPKGNKLKQKSITGNDLFIVVR